MCPVISTIIKASSGYFLSEQYNKICIRTQCYGLLFKSRWGDCRANVITHRNDQLLVACGVKKKAFKWFCKMGLTNSYTTVLKKNKSLCLDYDTPVQSWKTLVEGNDDVAKPIEYQVFN